jgi:hypothetical protein
MPEKQGNTECTEKEKKNAIKILKVKDLAAQAPVRYYRCDPNSDKWIYTGHCGILCFIVEPLFS